MRSDYPGNIRAAGQSELSEETERRRRQLTPITIESLEAELAKAGLSPLARATLKMRIAAAKRGG